MKRALVLGVAAVLLLLGAWAAQGQTVSVRSLLYWATNGMDIWNTNPGNVGIGTANPERKLDVNSGEDYVAAFQTTNVNAAIIRLENDNNRSWDIYHTGSGNGNGANKLGFVDASANQFRLLIDGSGNVGMGTTAPTERLDIAGGNVKMGYEVVTNSQSGIDYVYAFCPAGKKILGGGCTKSGSYEPLMASSPFQDYAWMCQWIMSLPYSGIVQATAICANIR